MSANAWLGLTWGVGVISVAVLGGAAMLPLLGDTDAPEGTRHQADPYLCYLVVPGHADGGAHLVAYSIVGLLLIGGVRGLAGFVRQIWRTRRVIRQLLHVAQPSDSAWLARLVGAGLAGRVDLIQTPVPLAFCYGFIQPRVCISTGLVALLAPDALAALLWHEYYHLLRGEPLRMALGRAWTAMFFFLPLAQAFYSRYLVAKEIDADRYACAQQGSPAALATALYVLLDWPEGPPDPAVPRATGAGATDALAERVAWLEGQSPPRTLPLRAAAGSGALLAAIMGLQLLFMQEGWAATLWQTTHMTLCGC